MQMHLIINPGLETSQDFFFKINYLIKKLIISLHPQFGEKSGLIKKAFAAIRNCSKNLPVQKQSSRMIVANVRAICMGVSYLV